ncbi:cation diffusion facilitator family transporter [Bacteroides cellulosilyticus]|uniref:cation diffusion facilitator family transporter n=1 Tax=Bacteroides cellulosilyticus TaxID=246787 RepID=UPI001C3764B4|nr:cation diffusion facilitator family transporter [Bacteroides cellulosilyticus]MBV3639067.1 cation diffusion facilitator family transporter [Bacteroides cellulosilyticus]MBV3665184.1 cation diffusion facilitator family transporter [Bacteroides cellulosilyticus]MBV3687162.1 cation diffusion facilitator family transporter [Bacteroides cellulosilyticus]MBV3695906.1 cation diffusion facilitator family transporter [Bacteroides cellulosilyticus]MBV3709475.1 cation diffusion facilitator family tran
MSHEHSHQHSHAINAESLNKAFIIGIVLNLAFVVIEFAAGFWFDSLALLSDAGHNLSDVVSLVLALLAFRLAKVKANERYTYGYKKSTILVSLLNAVILLVAVGAIVIESIHKLSNPAVVPGGAIAWVAGVGVLINAFTAFLFMKDKEKDLNVKGAYLHMAADALVSVGVLVAGIVISRTGWYIIDPIIGLIVAVVILISTWNLLHDSLRLTLDGVPASIDSQKVVKAIRALPGVDDVHHIHIWAISTTENALTAHIVLKQPEGMQEVKHLIRHRLEDFGIGHATLEFEVPGEHCEAVFAED